MTIRNTRVTKRLVAVAAATATMAAMLAIPTSPVGATSTVTSVRITGADREATSVAIAAAASDGGAPFTANNTNFVLANSRSYADSVTASALAGKLDGTIILLPADGSLSDVAKAELVTATNVFIVGGPAVVPATVEGAVQLASSGATAFTRLGGATRFETMKLVADSITAASVGNLGNKKTVLLASATNFADAVSASPAAYAETLPVLITNVDTLAPETKAAIASLTATQVVILGGTASISEAVEEEIDAMAGVSVLRVAGADRYATADEFAKLLMKSPATGGLGWTAANVGLANLAPSGDGADALGASAYLGQAKAPMLGTNNGVLPATTTAFLDTNKAAVATLHIFGGTSAVPADVVTAAETASGKVANPTATITATEKSKVATIVFSEKVLKNGALGADTATSYQILGANGAAFAPAEITSVTLAVAPGETSGTVAKMVFADQSKMVEGVVIQVIPGIIETADGRSVEAASTTIVKDATVPAATLTAVIGTSGGDTNVFSVSFSEPVTTALVASDFTINGVPIPAINATYTLGGETALVAYYDGAVVVITAPTVMGQAQTVAIIADAVTDAALNGNTAASTVVVADASKPTLTSATLAVTATATAQVVSGEGKLLFQAKTAGVAGNAVAVDFEGETGAATTVTTATAAGVTTITVTPLNTASPAEVAASIAANATANGLVDITVLDNTPTSFNDDPADALVGGASTATVTMTFSEDVRSPNVAQINYDADAAGGGIAVVAAGTAVATGNVVVSAHPLTLANQLPGLNVANVALAASAVKDNGGNPSAVAALNF